MSWTAFFIGYYAKNINSEEEYIKGIGNADKSNKVILEKHIPAIYNINIVHKTPKQCLINAVWLFMIERRNYENYW